MGEAALDAAVQAKGLLHAKLGTEGLMCCWYQASPGDGLPASACKAVRLRFPLHPVIKRGPAHYEAQDSLAQNCRPFWSLLCHDESLRAYVWRLQANREL